MGKFSGILLASDYDDTLLGSDLTICQRNVQALRYFMAEGGTFCVATGRAYSAFVNHWEKVPMNAPTVLSNGSSIYDFPRGEWIMQTYLCDETRSRLLELVQVFPELGFEAYHGEDIYAYNPNLVTQLHMERVGAAFTVCPIEEMPGPWNKVIFEQEYDLLAQVKDYILSHWPEDYEIIFSNRYLLEFTAKGSHKGNMVRNVAKRMGIDEGNIYCVGDNENDIPMLKVSAVPFAPANCAPVVKAWGATLVSSCDDGAIADIIQFLDER
jgi:hypothetical protein